MKTEKVAIAAVHFEPDGRTPEVRIQLREPGIVRCASIDVHVPLVHMGREQDLEERLIAFVECDPGAPMRSRRFLVLASNQAFTPPDGHHVEYVTTARSDRTGSVAHIFEIRPLS